MNLMKGVKKKNHKTLIHKGKSLVKALGLKKWTQHTAALREIAFSLLACSSSPCFHDGTCLLDQTGFYKCACLAGYTGQHCENREYASRVGVKMSCGVTVESLLGILFPGVWVGLFKMAHNRDTPIEWISGRPSGL